MTREMARKKKRVLKAAQKALKAMQKMLIGVANIAILAYMVMEVVTFFIQLLTGHVKSGTVVFVFAVAIMTAIVVTTIVYDKESEKGKHKLFREYKMKITAAAILFVEKGQLTERELKKFMSIMRYAARENEWEEQA